MASGTDVPAGYVPPCAVPLRSLRISSARPEGSGRIAAEGRAANPVMLGQVLARAALLREKTPA